MTPDDERHGTNAGYIAGCREQCCKTGHADYRRKLHARQYIARGPMTIPAIGTQRRIQALQAMGWRIADIARELNLYVASGGQCRAIWRLMERDVTTRATAARIDAVYRRLCMTPGPSSHSKARALNRGYLPPLAWNNIDDPNETPRRTSNHATKTDVDPVVVLRVIAGDRLPMTTAERRAVVARARALGWSEETIHERTGIARASDAARYGEREAS